MMQLLVRIGSELPKPGHKIAIISNILEKKDSHSIFSLYRALIQNSNSTFIDFLKKYGFQLLLFTNPEKDASSLNTHTISGSEKMLNIVNQEGKCIFLTILNIPWSSSTECYALAGEYSDDGDLIIPNSMKIILNPPPFRVNPDTLQRIRLHDPVFVVVSESTKPEFDIERALIDHSMIPAKMVYISLEKLKEIELCNSFYLELPFLKDVNSREDSRNILDYGVEVLQDIIRCIISKICGCPRSLEKTLLHSEKKIPEAWYTGRKYINIPTMSQFR
ncbi:MAG: hypothetical protein ACFFCS_06545 [Candidatus Hodarchaeota archaeon]